MRPTASSYPVDRYMVERSSKFEMVNIIDDEIWTPEPALKPEDEIILRKLHEMLQSTADDLKMLSGELTKYHEPGIQVKTQPLPLDEEFNEKVHIEEVVNAKFHGYRIVDRAPPNSPVPNPKESLEKIINIASKLQKPKVNTAVQVDSKPIVKKPVSRKNLTMTRTKVIEIDAKKDTLKNEPKTKSDDNYKIKKNPTVAYNEISYECVKPKVVITEKNKFKIQELPSINIRSELKEQKVFQLDIIPEKICDKENPVTKSNVAVIAMTHEPAKQNTDIVEIKNVYPEIRADSTSKVHATRKVLKMSTCESSGSTNNVSSDTKHDLRTRKQIISVIRTSPNPSARMERPKNKKSGAKRDDRRPQLNLDEWKKRLNVVYGSTPKAKTPRTTTKLNTKGVSPKKSNIQSKAFTQSKSRRLNNAEYIPYSQLTLGGARLSDIEREISDLPNKSDVPLSPILDKIFSSKEHSFHNDSPRKGQNDTSKILTTSDENLLREVIDIQRTVTKTINQNFEENVNGIKDKANVSTECNEVLENDSYDDDFEDDKSDNTPKIEKQTKMNDSESERNLSGETSSDYNYPNDGEEKQPASSKTTSRFHNRTYTKTPNLSFKNTVDVFEFVHSVATQEIATQSNATHKISLEETQTSPRSDKPNIKPIHNDLWPSIDPQGEVENMFKLEKEFIKKMILDEYGDLLEKNLTKPSTSKDANDDSLKNITAFQKNTQTSPAHVKSVMTSPTRTKTRPTSPFLTLRVDNQTSPMIVVTNEEELNIELENDEDLGISINLSSPRFSLRLPQTSREVLSNLEVCSANQSKIDLKDSKHFKDSKPNSRTYRKSSLSSSSVDDDYSSSEISSLGEVKMKLKRKTRKIIETISESSSTSTLSINSSDLLSAGIIPLRSEGEVSMGQRRRKTKISKSEGEITHSYGQLNK